MQYLSSFFGGRPVISPKTDVSHAINTGKGSSGMTGSNVFLENPPNLLACEKQLISYIVQLERGESVKEDLVFTVSGCQTKDIVFKRLSCLFFVLLPKSEGFFMLTSMAKKDIGNGTSESRAHALRVMTKICTPPFPVAIEVPVVQDALNSGISFVCQAALSFVLSYMLNAPTNLNEADAYMQAINPILPVISQISKDSSYPSQHIALMIQLKRNEFSPTTLRQAIPAHTRNSLGAHVRIQMAGITGNESILLEYMNHSTNDINKIDAIRTILANEKASPEALTKACSMLQVLLTSKTKVNQFAALRTIQKYASRISRYFDTGMSPLELLLRSPDTDLSSRAAVAMLIVGGDHIDVDKVLDPIGNCSGNLPISQQVSIVDCCVQLAVRYPQRQARMLSFLWEHFRLVENYDVQQSLSKGLCQFAQQNPDAIRSLCEYLEDSRYADISVSVIHFLGDNCKGNAHQMEIVRCLANRFDLDCPQVRAAALDALSRLSQSPNDAKIAHAVNVTIGSMMNDDDIEVRERAAFYLTCIQMSFESLMQIQAPEVVQPDSQDDMTSAQTVAAVEASPLGDAADIKEYGPYVMALDDIMAAYKVQVSDEKLVFVFYITSHIKPEINAVSVTLSDVSTPAEYTTTTIETLPYCQDAEDCFSEWARTCYIEFENTMRPLVFDARVVFTSDGEIIESDISGNYCHVSNYDVLRAAAPEAAFSSRNNIPKKGLNYTLANCESNFIENDIAYIVEKAEIARDRGPSSNVSEATYKVIEPRGDEYQDFVLKDIKYKIAWIQESNAQKMGIKTKGKKINTERGEPHVQVVNVIVNQCTYHDGSWEMPPPK